MSHVQAMSPTSPTNPTTVVDLMAEEEKMLKAFGKLVKQEKANKNKQPENIVQPEDGFISEDQFLAQEHRVTSAISLHVKKQQLERESAELYMFGSNALHQLALPGAERKLLPFAAKFTKTKRVVYMHCDLTSTFCLTRSREMIFWGTTPLNPNQHIKQTFEVGDVPSVASGLSLAQLDELRRLRDIDVEREKNRAKARRKAAKLVELLPESKEIVMQRGLATEVEQLLPHKFVWKAPSPIIWIACGLEHVCGVTGDGRVFTFGSGANGRLGHGLQQPLITPKFIKFDSKHDTLKDDKVVQCCCGADFTVLLTEKGKVWTFGCGNYGQLGNGGDSDQGLPQQVGALREHKIVELAVGSHHTIALTSHGELFGWGLNTSGQCGVAHLEAVTKPQMITYCRHRPRKQERTLGQIREKRRIAKLKRNELAKKASAKKKANAEDTGDHFAHQQLEKESSSESDNSDSSDNFEKWKKKKLAKDELLAKKGMKRSPNEVKMLEKQERAILKRWELRKKIKAKHDEERRKEDDEQDPEKKAKMEAARLAREEKEKRLRQKRHLDRKLGKKARLQAKKRQERLLPDSHDLVQTHLFFGSDMLKVPLNFVHVRCGSRFSAAITEDGRLYMWGDNAEGQLGNGCTHFQKVPTLVRALALETVLQVACGRKHTVALTASGKVFSWGGNTEGQLGHGHRQPCWVPTEILALRGKHIALISCGLDHTVCLEGKLVKQNATKLKFLTREEMNRKIHESQKKHAQDIQRARKQNIIVPEMVKDEATIHHEVVQEHRAQVKDTHQRAVVVRQKQSRFSKKEKAAGATLVAVSAMTMAAAAAVLGG